jgi:hypothetical protein
MIDEILPAQLETIGAIVMWTRPGHTHEMTFVGLPYLPLWPGFMINTVFYALVLWLLFAAPLALRRRIRGRRINRGMCPKCAYDLRGHPHPSPFPKGEGVAVCPECGAIIVRRASVA